MATGGPLPFLNFCGLEIANSARTLEYLRAGLGNTTFGHWEVGNGQLCSVLYRQNGGTCAVPDKYKTPALDPAPWYDAKEPGSSQFLGLALLDIQGWDSTLYRATAPRLTAMGGGTFGGQHRNLRPWKFRGVLVSSGDVGAEYGLRWLTDVLQASACDTCSTCSMSVRLTCPPADCSDDTQGEWFSYEVALIDGPHEVEPWGPSRMRTDSDVLAGCRDYVTVEFTLAAGNPYLYKRPKACLSATMTQVSTCTDICDFLFGSPGQAVCCSVAPPVRGTLGSIYTLTPSGSSGASFGGVILEAYAQCPGSAGGSNPAVAELSIELSAIPAYSTVVVDSAKHTITVATFDPVTGKTTVTDGQYLVVLPKGRSIQWLEVRDCDDITCFCIRTSSPCSSGTLNILVQTQAREG
jgi:hypothetical protein